MTEISLNECVDRGIYRVYSRNLDVAVFVGDSRAGFVGIREKFGSRFLDTEYHRETGPPHGTLRPYEFLEMLPQAIPTWEAMPGAAPGIYGTWDRITGREVSFDDDRKRQSNETGIGWGWYFFDTGEDDPDCKIEPHGRANTALFDYLDLNWFPEYLEGRKRN